MRGSVAASSTNTAFPSRSSATTSFSGGKTIPSVFDGALRRHGDDLEAALGGGQQHDSGSRAGEPAGLFGDDLEGVLGVTARQECGGDGHRAVDPALALLGGLVQTGVADGDARLRGQHADHVEVVVVERPAATLLGQVQVPEDLTLHPDRDPQEAPASADGAPGTRTSAGHPSGSASRTGSGSWMSAPSSPLCPSGSRPISPAVSSVDPVEHEVDEPVPVLRHDPDRRVPRVRQLGRRLTDPVQRGVQLQPGSRPTASPPATAAPARPARRTAPARACARASGSSSAGGRLSDMP